MSRHSGACPVIRESEIIGYTGVNLPQVFRLMVNERICVYGHIDIR